jgi:tetratricopeptide (TPR) repeat protein
MISVCSLGKACKKAGSPEIARFLSDVAAMTTGLEVESVGCLGHCGKGPNIVVHQETGQHTVVHHIATPSDALELLRGLSSSLALSEVDVEAMSLRLQANQKAMSSDLDAAMDLYNKALTLKPSVGRHLIYCNRSALQLQKGFKEEALQDALDALDLDSKHVKSWIRAIDASYALERYSEAAEMFKLASEVTAFKSALEYKSIRFALAAKGQRL